MEPPFEPPGSSPSLPSGAESREALAREVAGAGADPGRRFGRYILLSELGRGGMGVVYRAWDPSLQRLVAIKLIQAGDPSSQVFQRFIREARAAAKLRHPAIVSVHEFGEHAGRPYLVMDFVRGESLAAWLARAPAPKEVVRIVLELTRALEYAHAEDVIHRDLKPANVVLEGGRPRLMDFGLARDMSSSDHLTRTGQVLGTPSYMAPEQAGDDTIAVGPHTDVYGLGAVLYRGLTGRPPFEADAIEGLLRKVLFADPTPPSALVAEVPAALDAIVLKCLEKRPEDRYPSAAALAADLEAWLGGRRVSARLGPVRAKRRRRRRAARVLAAVALALGLGAATWLATARPAPPELRIDAPVRGAVVGEPSVTIAGTVVSGSLRRVWIDGEPTDVAAGRFERRVLLAAGENVIAIATSEDGPVVERVSVLHDIEDPVIEIESPRPDAVVSTAAPVIRGVVRDARPDRVMVVGGEPSPVGEDGRFELTAPAREGDGPREIELVATDRAGRIGRAVVRVVVDLAGPAIDLVAPAPEASVMTDGVLVSGRVDDPTIERVSVGRRRRVEVHRGGLFAVRIDGLAEGRNEIAVSAADAAGNETIARVVVHAVGRPERPEGAWWQPASEQLAHAREASLPLFFDVEPSGQRMVLIPPGSFYMGSAEDEPGRWHDEQLHRVTLTRPYYIATTEVTNAQFRLFRPDHRSTPFKEGIAVNPEDDRDDVPVSGVTWDEATAYCAWLTARANDGRTYRLPTEAEWERACRAGSVTVYPWGDDDAEGHRHANINNPRPNAEDSWPTPDPFELKSPGGSFAPNAFGIFDMIGNVSEHCADHYDEGYAPEPAVDPRGPPAGPYRIWRNGSRNHGRGMARSARRRRDEPYERWYSIGFRIAADASR